MTPDEIRVKFTAEMERHYAQVARNDRTIRRVYALQAGETLAVDDRDLRACFANNFNPLKGETAKSELTRWINFIYVTANIRTLHEPQHFQYVFHKIDPIVEYEVETVFEPLETTLKYGVETVLTCKARIKLVPKNNKP